MPLSTDVKARIQSSAGECWESTFPAGSVGTGALYEAKTP